HGTESWGVGTSQNITWEYTGSITNVSIEASYNNGITYTVTITTGATASIKSYPWTIPNNVTTEAMIRIRDVSDPAVTASSAAKFTIEAGALDHFTLTLPSTATQETYFTQ
ncbi:MAG: hypothetical protein NT099_01665, partial [Candidatus Saganbacteria bacterium]|nr:hypothetical protein [Candidatus Saganbacteria bacterium]